MADSFREVTQEGFFSRIKGAIGGVVVGLVMVVAAFPVQFWNEGRAVKQTQTLQQGEAAVKSVATDRVDPANEGQLVHIAGNVVASDHVVDEDFGLDLAALGLRRKVEMYQWKEEEHTKERKKLGGGTERETTYTYEKTWDDDAIDSSDFRHPDGHENPGAFPVSSRTITAVEGRLGAYALNADVLAEIDEWSGYAVPAGAVATDARFRRDGDGFYLGENRGSPRIGDVRVSFRIIPEGEYTFVAQQSGQGLVPWLAPAGNSLLLIATGKRPAPELFATAHSRNTLLTWALRGAGFAMMWLGFSLLLRPFVVLADVVPLIGSIVGFGIGLFSAVLAFALSMGTIAIAWFFYRPMLSVVLVALGIGAFFLLRRRRRPAATMQPPMAPPPGMMPPPPPPAR